MAPTSAATIVSFGRIVFVNLVSLAGSTCPRNIWTNPAGDRTSERERSEWQSYSGGPVIPQHSRAQKINAPRTTLTIKAAADPPIAEIHVPRPDAGLWSKRRSQRPDEIERDGGSAGTARPTPTLWKMPTTKTRSPFFRQNLIRTFTEYYRLGNIDAIQLRVQETGALRSVGIGMERPNVISKAFAYAKIFCRSHCAAIDAYDAIDT